MSRDAVTHTPVGPCCLTCRFYLLESGLCRRNPPQVLATGKNKSGDHTWLSVFPPMQPTGWCGEFKEIAND